MQSKQLRALGTKHGGRCPYTNDPDIETLDVDVSCGLFLMHEVHQQNQNISVISCNEDIFPTFESCFNA